MEAPFPQVYPVRYGFIEWCLVALCVGLAGAALATLLWAGPRMSDWAANHPHSTLAFVVFLLVGVVLPIVLAIMAIGVGTHLGSRDWARSQVRRHCRELADVCYSLSYVGVRDLIRDWDGDVTFVLDSSATNIWVQFVAAFGVYNVRGSYNIREGKELKITVRNVSERREVSALLDGNEQRAVPVPPPTRPGALVRLRRIWA